jgi:lauroyl/myristoyl acyltransferase
MQFRHKISYTSAETFFKLAAQLVGNREKQARCKNSTTELLFTRLRKKDSLKNIAIAFPEKSENERNAILKKTYSFFAKSFLQFLSFPKSYRFTDIDVEGKELLDHSLAKGKGVILTYWTFRQMGNFVSLAWLCRLSMHCGSPKTKKSRGGYFLQEI